MTNGNPFAAANQLIGQIVSTRATPEFQLQKLQLGQLQEKQKQDQITSNILRNYLATADLSKKGSIGFMQDIAAITGNTKLVQPIAEQLAKENAFKVAQDQLRELRDGTTTGVAEFTDPKSELGEQLSEREAFELSQRQAVIGESGRDAARITKGQGQRDLLSEKRKELELKREFDKPTKEFRFTKEGTNLTLQLQDRATKASESFNVVLNNIVNIEAAVERMLSGESASRLATDQAVITSFNKILDPESVVRESEYKRTPENASLINRARGAMQKLSKGGAGITDEDIIEIRDTARQMAELKREITNKKLNKFRKQAEARDLDPDEVATFFNPIKVIKKTSTPIPVQVPEQQQFDSDSFIKSLGL